MIWIEIKADVILVDRHEDGYTCSHCIFDNDGDMCAEANKIKSCGASYFMLSNAHVKEK